MTKHVFIGDIHGNTKLVTKLGNRFRDANVIQIGDFGVGFNPNKIDPPQLPENCRFIRGNHDNPASCKMSPHWIQDGHTEITDNGTKIMYIGGAYSIDKEWRTPGLDWWEDEECSIEQLYSLYDQYLEFKPDVMVTHDGPMSVLYEMFITGTHKPLLNTRTGQAFDEMFKAHQPKHWIFGHWHMNKKMNILGCDFECINIDTWRSYEF